MEIAEAQTSLLVKHPKWEITRRKTVFAAGNVRGLLKVFRWVKKYNTLDPFLSWNTYNPLQSREVKRHPQVSINKLIIGKMNQLVTPITSVKFKSA